MRHIHIDYCGLDDALEGLCIKMHYIALTISTIKEKYLKALSMCRQPLRVSNTYLIILFLIKIVIIILVTFMFSLKIMYVI